MAAVQMSVAYDLFRDFGVANQVADFPVYRKTLSGYREIEARNVVSRAELRRLLVLIDGHRDLRALGACFRAGELVALIKELEALGLVESTSASPSFDSSALGDASSFTSNLSAPEFAATRAAARESAEALLGMGFAVYASRFDSCTDSGELRRVVSDVKSKLLASYGQDAATLYIECVRDAAEQARIATRSAPVH